MRNHATRIAAVLLIASLFAAAARADDAPPSVAVGGVVDHPGDWTVDKIKHDLAGDVKRVTFTSHGASHQSDCVPLLALLNAAGAHLDFKMDPKADPKTKNYPLRLTILVKGSDGYTVSFALAELLPAFGAKDVWVALDLDGQPLADKDQPVRLIVPSDQKPGRWVHGVSQIEVVDPTAPATQPAP